jgi:hypothetical protein
MRVVSRVATLLAVGVASAGQSADDVVREGYTVPKFVIPYAAQSPVMDGVIDPVEWKQALQINLTQQLKTREVSAMQTQWFLMWDEDNLYVAMRSPLREGERLRQGQRRRDRDYNVVFDDSYEFWIDVGSSSPDGQPVFFQFLGNFAGARFDCLFEPQVGNSRLGWTSHWNPVNRVSDDNAWEYEMAVPRDSVYAAPFKDGQLFRMLLARNFKRPWLQNSVTGQADFSSRDSFARFVLSKTAPAVHVHAVGDPAANTFGLALSAFSPKATALRWSFETETGISRSGELKLEAGKIAELPADLKMAEAANDKLMRLRVTTADGMQTLADWSAHLNYSARDQFAQAMNDRGDEVNLGATLNPVKDYIRVSGDFIYFDARDSIAKVEATVFRVADNKKLAETEFKIDELAYASGVMQLKDLEAGAYRIEMFARDADGGAVLTRTTEVKKLKHAEAFPWWNTKVGNKDKVLPPWTPVTYKDGTFGVWGRTMTAGQAGLPSSIVTQGRELLARPAELLAETASGERLVAVAGARKTVGKPVAHRAVVDNTATMGGIAVTSRVTVEYDGVYKMELTLDPKQPVDLKSLQIVLPFRSDAVNYVHGSGEGIRYGFSSMFLPEKGNGRLWDSTRVDGQPMKVGSFIPYVWIGSTGGGLAWFADSDEGWVPNNKVPAIEIRREARGTSTDLILNLVSEPFTLDAPRTITIGLQASPVKALAPNWRANRWTFDATFHDFAGITTQPGRQHMDLIWQAVPYVIDKEYASKKAAEWKKSRGMAVPYFEQNVMGNFRPDPGYFGEHWKASVGNTLWFDKTLQDFIVYHLHEWVGIADIDGWYVDNIRPEACANIEAGRGYRLPDGRIQPTFQIFEQRDYWLRVRAAFIEAGKNPPVLVLHMTHNVVLPWLGAAELALDHEANVIFPEMGKDYMDVWSLERLRLNYPGQSGVAFISMSKYDGDWSKASAEVKERNARSYVGANRLHDVLVQSNNELDAKVRAAFGFGEPDVQFIGYWEKGTPVTSRSRNIYTSAWTRPGVAAGQGQMLVIITNWGDDTEADVRIDEKLAVATLGPRAGWKVVEPESGQALAVAKNGTVRLVVPKHHFRYLWIQGGAASAGK